MSKITIGTFAGIAPKLADYQLDQGQASFAANHKVTSGELRGFRSLELIEAIGTAGTEYRRAVKLYYPGSSAFEWWLNTDVNAAVLQSPLANDAFNRVYYTDNTHAKMQITTLAMLDAGTPSYDVGVIRPTAAPTVVATGGTGDADVRAYCYLYISNLGEEGAPSPATIETGHEDSTWTISGIPAAPGAHITFVDIYRTATGEQSSGNYYRVKRVAVGTTSTVDSMPSDLVPLQPPLDSLDNDPPPAGIQGIILHSSGAVAGFKGRDVYFSRPYLPHAWPGATKYTMPFEVVALASVGNSIIVLTKGFSVALSGTFPDTMAPANMVDAEPCMAGRSVVVTNNTVFYASPNGLATIGANGAGRPTNQLVTREEWSLYLPNKLVAGLYGSYYIAFWAASLGLAITLPPFETIDLVTLDRYNDVTGVETDARSGDLHIITGDHIWRFDQLPDARFATTWRSKEFIMPAPMNFGAVQIIFGNDPAEAEFFAALVEQLRVYNETRFAQGPLDTLNMYPLGGFAPADPAITPPSLLPVVPPLQVFGGSPLYDLDAVLNSKGVRFTLIGDGNRRYSRLLARSTVYTLPSEYKATRYYLELSGSVTVQRVIVAETRRECRNA
jgi:hypothetical protein